MDQFTNRIHQVSDTASGGGFYKGFLTAMIELGAVIGKSFFAGEAQRKNEKKETYETNLGNAADK